MGEVFAGRYELLDPIGEGGMGTVWLAWDQREGVHRAAKMLRHSDAGSLIRFIREQSFRIDSEHCVSPLGWSAEDDRVLFTMDLVRGGSVHSLLKDYGPLPGQWAACLLDQLLVALDAVHSAGIVHRDVKPGNLLLEPTGLGRPHLRLSDFGIAIAAEEPRLTEAYQLLGTPGYRAPEQGVMSDPSPAQDLWAAGVVLMEMLTATRPPADSGSLAAVAPDGVDQRLWNVARSLTSRDPAFRPASALDARRLLAQTGQVPPEGVAPDDEGRQVEVLEHLDLPVQPPAQAPARTPWARSAVLGMLATIVGLGLLSTGVWMLFS